MSRDREMALWKVIKKRLDRLESSRKQPWASGDPWQFECCKCNSSAGRLNEATNFPGSEPQVSCLGPEIKT